MWLLRISYEFPTSFARSSNNLHKFVSFVCVCVCVCVRVYLVAGVVVCLGVGAWCVRTSVIFACIGGSWVVGVWMFVGVDGWTDTISLSLCACALGNFEAMENAGSEKESAVIAHELGFETMEKPSAFLGHAYLM